MCALCGVLGREGDWAEASGIAIPEASLTRRAQRQERVRLANSVLRQFGLILADWQGAKYQLANRTGRTELVDNLPQVWQAAEHILGRACDPLDPALIARIEQSECTG
jgi:hypothetical protein